MHPLVRQVQEFLGNADCEGGIVVAVSGGPDSVALFRALLELSPALTPRLVVAHLNHRLRGDASDADERFVRELAQTASAGPAKVEFRGERADVAALASAERDNLEKIARKVRYNWLTRVSAEHGIGCVATGHTADDQAETVFHRLFRGTGLRGLRGIAPRRPLAPGVHLIRPLLAVRRATALAYLAELRQPYRFDETNADARFTRNRIRLQLLPLLEREYNPAIVSVLNRLAEQADRVYRDVESAGRELLRAAERPRAGPLVIVECGSLASAPRNLVREAFRLLWEREGWPMNAMTHDAWDRLASLAFGERSAVDLPGGLCGRRRGRVVQVGPHP